MRSNLIKNRSFLVTFVLISFVYIVGIAFLDETLSFDILDVIQVKDVFVILSLFFIGIIIRYVRWHFLMKNNGVDAGFAKSFFFYVSGFAYTATPGKVGELSRVIHYRNIGVSSDIVISSFIIERFFDLVVILIMASTIFLIFPGFKIVAFSIIIMIGGIFLCSINVRFSKKICKKFLINRNFKIARFFCLIYKVLLNINHRMNVKVVLTCLVLGGAAWTCTSFILIYVCHMFSVNIPVIQMFSVYPTAMLSGAVSFIPGGIGATESVIIFLLNQFDTPIPIASTVALLVRFSTLWLAMFIGMLCTVISSVYIAKHSN
ncbi:lysylphosphatidylglycerol synthase transmembrane domain-containing protein [Vibrio scophthalmi]|uniref:lysylphosphatidylglycerol synthase transmembrane domain-containing protein n=1 Tax=Vibrio scophthalmi TaxID=45658 RepID=UPI003EB7FF7D